MPLQDWGLFDRVITEPVTEPVVPRPRVEDAVPAAAAPAATAGARIGAFGNFMNLFGQMSTQNGGASGETQAAEQITSDLIKSGGMKITPVFISEPRGLLGLSKWYFPFSPIINTNFSTNYSSYNMTHSNYQQMAFDSSENAQLSIIGNVTARDEAEAEFILAGYCFFRGAMKMFWEKDGDNAGNPPPILRLNAYNIYQNVPVLVSGFTWNLEDTTDYVTYDSEIFGPGVSIPKVSSFVLQLTTTYGPKNIRNNFSVKDYAAGKLNGIGYL